MVRMGIARQLLSPMPELLSYWLPLDDALPLIRHVNTTIAAMVARAGQVHRAWRRADAGPRRGRA
jgi:aminocarboxymuconate-semialdehyde decarboxylase